MGGRMRKDMFCEICRAHLRLGMIFDKEYYADLEGAFTILTRCTDLFIDPCGLQKLKE